MTDQAGKMVMTIGKNGQPMPVPVTVGPVIDGLRVIKSRPRARRQGRSSAATSG